MESCKITDFLDLCQQLSSFGTVTIKGSIITVTNDKLYDKSYDESYKDILGSWRKSVHAFIGNMTDGSWISERRSTRMIKSDNCRHCRKKLGKYQDADCKCHPDMGFPDLGCNCYYGFNSKKGYGPCESESENYTCRQFYIRVFNAVYVYKTNSTVPKLPLHQRLRNVIPADSKTLTELALSTTKVRNESTPPNVATVEGLGILPNFLKNAPDNVRVCAAAVNDDTVNVLPI